MTSLLSLKSFGTYQIKNQELIVDAEPLIFIPDLAKLLWSIYGSSTTVVVDTIVLQRIHFEVIRLGVTRGKYPWTQIESIDNWNREIFKFHRVDIVRNSLAKMKQHNILVQDDNFYRVNYYRLEKPVFDKRQSNKIFFKPRKEKMVAHAKINAL